MDAEVIKVFVSIDHVLSFVENIHKLKGGQHRFFSLIEETLRIIQDCGKFIIGYLHGNTRGEKSMGCAYNILTVRQIEHGSRFPVKRNLSSIRMN